jgi:hypothetical protein
MPLGAVVMSFVHLPLSVTATVMLVLLVACAAPDFGMRATLPRPIVLSANDRVTPETRFQIEEANYKIQQLAERYQFINNIPLPIP